MIKVLIADDDNIVRIGLSSIIDWQEHGYELVGKAADGGEALELCVKLSPDILITDVEMPRVDGIELIDRVNEVCPNVKIIVLSNHDNFQYVSKSFKKGVSDYLLKQFLEPEELIAALDKMRNSMTTQESGAAQISDTNNVQSAKGSIKDFIKVLEEKLSEPSEEPEAGAFVIRFLSESASDINHQILKVALTEKLSKYADVYVYSDWAYGKVTVVLIGNIYDEKLSDVSKDISELADSYFGISCNVGISDATKSVDVQKLLENANTALEYLDFINERGSSLFYSDMEESEELSARIIQLVNGMHDYLMMMDIDKPLGELKRIMLSISREKYLKIKTVKHSLNSIFYQMLIFLSDYFDENYDAVLEQIHSIKDILNQEDRVKLGEIIKKTDTARQQISGYIANYKNKTGYMGRIKEYIDINYVENITLKILAEKFSLSDKYLSSEFKKKMNINVIEYLNKVRIQHAIDLLHKTDMTASDIAQKTGFSSPNYFIRVFKKVTGKTISEYRNME